MKNFYTLLSLFCCLFISSCTYNESIENAEVTITLSEPLAMADITITSSTGVTFNTITDESGEASITLAPGIYNISASYTTDDGYIRTASNGSKNDVIVSGSTANIYLPIVTSTIMLNNPILIKEIYVGGCQKDDGSGAFLIDKCIILYNNSSQRASLDNIAFGIIEPYNAEANNHSFLAGGILEYEDADWVPSMNGIWYFQPGHFIEPYSELVVNIFGCIDNTLTYSQSINYAKPDYFTMYDVEATSNDGTKYNNTGYYPSPSEVVPTSHYLKAVKYGQANAWPISATSPAIILFRPENLTIKEFGENPDNLIFPADKQGDLIYACLKVPRAHVLDAVEVFNAEKIALCKKRLTPDLDSGYVPMTGKSGHALVRRIERYVDGHPLYQDTNNSSKDFYETDACSLR